MIRDHMAETDRKIRAAAKDILDQMGQRPVLLNTLRSVRVTANVRDKTALVGPFLMAELTASPNNRLMRGNR